MSDAFTADVVVVLGGGVEPDGSLPPVARTRVERAVELYERRVAPRLVLSGRCGLTSPDPDVTEAAAMAAHAWTLGVPTASRTTLEGFGTSKPESSPAE